MKRLVYCFRDFVFSFAVLIFSLAKQNGFSIIKVLLTEGKHESRKKASRMKRTAIIKGISSSLVEGEYIKAEGKWENNSKYGLQFVSTSIRGMAPMSLEAVRKYLGTFRGVGPSTAERLTQAFPGDSIFKALDEDANQLCKVKGVGKALSQSMEKEWSRKRHSYATSLRLSESGIGSALGEVLIKRHGEDILSILDSNPYALVSDDGITFHNADVLAKKMGMQAKDSNRVRCALVQRVLQITQTQGHCCVSCEELVTSTAKFLRLEKSDVQDALQMEIEDETRLVGYKDGWVYPHGLYEAETQFIKDIKRLSDNPHPFPFVDVEQLVKWMEEQGKVKLAPMQAVAVRDALKRKLLIITGGPGVGKTTTIASIVKIYGKLRLRTVLASPTGRASARLTELTGKRAVTLHRLLDYNPDAKTFKRSSENMLSPGLYLIDEASMMDVKLASAFFQAIPSSSVVVLVGDVNQLPSVSPGNVLKDLVKSEFIPMVELNRIFRQSKASESSIVSAAHSILGGRLPKLNPYEVATRNQDFCFLKAETEDEIIRGILKSMHSMPLGSVNDVQVLTPMKKGKLGSWNLNSILQNFWNPKDSNKSNYTRKHGSFNYRRGDKVMQMVNNYEKDVFNGGVFFFFFFFFNFL